MPRISKIEQAIRDTGAIRYGEFTAHNGEQGNVKVELDDLLNDDLHKDLLKVVIEILAGKLRPFEPEILLPMPEGANELGGRLARKLGARAILLEWKDKEAGQLAYRDQHERIVVCRADRIVLVDDVLRTGSTFEQAVGSLELGGKKLKGAEVWDRTDRNNPPNLDFDTVAVVKKFIPIRLESDPNLR